MQSYRPAGIGTVESSHAIEIHGTAASSGRRRGRALVVECTTDLADVVIGDIVVATSGRLEYAPTLRRAGGLIFTGGVLSNLAIVARELGIPAVVASPEALGQVQTGDELALDGMTGFVRVQKAGRRTA